MFHSIVCIHLVEEVLCPYQNISIWLSLPLSLLAPRDHETQPTDACHPSHIPLSDPVSCVRSDRRRGRPRSARSTVRPRAACRLLPGGIRTSLRQEKRIRHPRYSNRHRKVLLHRQHPSVGLSHPTRSTRSPIVPSKLRSDHAHRPELGRGRVCVRYTPLTRDHAHPSDSKTIPAPLLPLVLTQILTSRWRE